MFERFTKEARAVVLGAQQEAARLDHPVVGTEHLLLAMLGEGTGTASVLRDAGVTRDRVEEEIIGFVGAGHAGPDTPAGPAGPASPDGLDDADAAALRAIGIDIDAVRARIEESFGPGALSVPLDPGDDADGGWLASRRRGRGGRRGRSGRFSPRAKKVLELALREALRLKHNWIGSEHILLGLLREGQGLAAAVLTRQGVDLADLRRRALAALDRAA